jgi:DHA1 family bicyclomycin/chloramphenicol resistance-like MFS transporter
MGFALFIAASFICVNATSLEVMVIGRILQGIGLSAPRTMSIAIIRICTVEIIWRVSCPL